MTILQSSTSTKTLSNVKTALAIWMKIQLFATIVHPTIISTRRDLSADLASELFQMTLKHAIHAMLPEITSISMATNVRLATERL